MPIPFVKASACGNDFLIIDGSLAPADPAAFTRRICDRHQGVGADGVEWLYPAPGVDMEARLINADGSPAEISGNGTRCVAAYLCSERRNESFMIRTGAGDKLCNLTAASGNSYEFETAMGKPLVGDAVRDGARPVSDAASRVSTPGVTAAGRSVDGGMRTVSIQSPSAPGRLDDVEGIPVSMGNPHFVVFVEQFPGDWQRQAAAIQRDSSFPEGVNIEFVRVQDPSHIEVRFFERGVGETLSSGTGSSAAAAASIATGKAASVVRVEAPGGTQFVRWERGAAPRDQLYLRGSADLICRGEFFE
jgi:diaminopimelate epimerase